MTAIKFEPVVKVMAYPTDTITRRNLTAASISDVLTAMVIPSAGGASLGDITGTDFDGSSWQGQNGFTNIDEGIQIVRFASDGTALSGADAFQGSVDLTTKEMAGFYIRHQQHPQNCIVNPKPLLSDPQPSNDFPRMQWKPLSGSYWKTYVPYVQPYRNWIRHSVQMPDKALKIRTNAPLAAQQGFLFDVIWRGVYAGATQVPGFRVAFGNGFYSLVWRQGHAPEMQRHINGADTTWKTLKGLNSDFTGSVRVAFYILGGRLCVEIGDSRWWMMDTASGSPVSINLAAGNITVSSLNVDAIFNVTLLDYLDGATPVRASLSRTVPVSVNRIAASQNGVVKGWVGKKATMTVAGNLTFNQMSYTVTLSPDAYETPIASAVILDFPPTTKTKTMDAIDITPALKQMGYESMQPGVIDTASLSLEVYRSSLNKMIPSWQSTLKRFTPITVDVNWKYKDDVTCAVTSDAVQRLFEGYVINPDMSNDGFNTFLGSFQSVDPLCRFKEPAGFVDNRYPPGDWLFMQNNGAPLYDVQMVQFLIGRELGDGVANLINGNGDPFRFVSSPVPLLGNSELAGYFNTIVPPSQSGFYLPAPMGSYLNEWIQTLIKPQGLVFFWGWAPDAPEGRPVPIVGRIANIMAMYGNTVQVLPDQVYSAGEVDMFSTASLQNLSNKSFNEFVVWGPRTDAQMAILPSLFVGRAQVPPGSPGDIASSWRRTLMVQADYIGMVEDGQQLAQAMANDLMSEFNGTIPSEQTFSLPQGDPGLKWGMKVQPKMSSADSDATIGLDGNQYRILRVQHQWNAMRDTPNLFQTTLTTRSLSASGY